MIEIFVFCCGFFYLSFPKIKILEFDCFFEYIFKFSVGKTYPKTSENAIFFALKNIFLVLIFNFFFKLKKIKKIFNRIYILFKLFVKNMSKIKQKKTKKNIHQIQ